MDVKKLMSEVVDIMNDAGLRQFSPRFQFGLCS